MNPIDLETARCLVDFSGGDESLKPLGEMQIKGAVALQNMLADPNVGLAYLADEVGMGKTYIALGVVAMLRYFNPMLRVLYICPSRNVQEKWDREYKSFVRTNVRVNQGRIRTRDGSPAAPYKSCRNVVELIRAATSGYCADFFIGKSSFSMALSDDIAAWEKKRDELIELVPAHEWESPISGRQDVKEQYARALNYILPKFDLVVIDEAHNFKHGFESSDRNKVMSRVFGFRKKGGYLPRVRHALLLSATPYDRDLNQLRNQLNMVGRSELLPPEIRGDQQALVQDQLRKFMVRRLNELGVNGKRLTRNMYRREWRHGANAEVALKTDEQKLVTALVQKKVGELLTRQSDSPSFQTGLLASFESFAESTRSGPVEFDGDRADKQQTDAKDRHVLGQLVDSYVEAGLGRTLPHPKMDVVVRRLAEAIFTESRKQLVFVRRVKSVGEIKAKLDDEYNERIHQYIDQTLVSYDVAQKAMSNIYQSYLSASRERDNSDIDIGGEIEDVDKAYESLPAKNDTFFAWFFRGDALKEATEHLNQEGGNFPTPDAIRKGLVAKNQVVITLMEPNWAWYLCRLEDISLQDVLSAHGNEIAQAAGEYITGRLADDQLEVYQACQIAFIAWWMNSRSAEYLRPLFEHLATTHQKIPTKIVSPDQLQYHLGTSTIFTKLEEAHLASEISPYQAYLHDALKTGKTEKNTAKLLKLFDVHKALMSFVIRTAHGVIDLYLARMMQGTGNLTAASRAKWIEDFVGLLAGQRAGSGFSTYYELAQIAEHLEQIIKNNIPEIMDLNRERYTIYLSQTLNPVSPVIGASGLTTGRSSQARKFRMPGYPLVLISTDVFQEGEDLHTFCDSVVHYGLSGSPVSLEQKTGRVDRVGSIAQRRLTALERDPADEEYIQVTYPFVKESIESLQIRQICVNYNLFIESLHDVTSTEGAADDSINLPDAIDSKQPIPDRIPTRLESPYNPTIPKKNEHNSVSEIKAQERVRQTEIEHVKKLVEDALKNKGESDSAIYLGVGVRLRSAKASGELILSLTRRAELPPQQLDNRALLLKLMHDISWCTFHRTIAIESADKKGTYDLYFNAEMLVGGPEITHQADINRIFERMDVYHDPKQYSTCLSDATTAHIDEIDENVRVPIDRSKTTKINVSTGGGLTTLEFSFGDRSQKVRIFECDDRCIFLSYSTEPGFADNDNCTPGDIIKLTWARNTQIDLVEFVVDPEHRIVGRVVHPLANMTYEEFMYCAYTLAVEADDLEYLLHKSDIH